MVGEWRRRRRRRVVIRNVAGAVVAAVVVAVVVIVAVAAVAQIGPTSGPYYRTVDRSYAALAVTAGGPVERRRGGVDGPFGRNGPALTRTGYFAQLEQPGHRHVRRGSPVQTLSPPGPVGSAGPQCPAALEARAGAVGVDPGRAGGALGGRSGVGRR